MDQYASVRNLSFPAVAPILGIHTAAYRRSKDEWVGGCPIHQSKTNKNCFRYSDSGKFHCFSCSAKGRGMVDLAMQVKGLGFKAAVALLEPLVGSESSLATKKEPVEAPVASSEVLQPLAKDTWRKFAVPCPWLEERVPDVAVRERYGVFCYNNPARRSAYSGRVMLPVRDIEGQLFGYLGRSVSPSTGREEPKYLFPRNLPKSLFLFGAYELSQGLQAGRQDERCSAGQRLKVVYLLESPFAVMRFASLGLPAISPFGWSVSTHQIELLRGLTRGVVYLPDYNKRQDAGVHLAELAQNLWLRFPPLPAGCEDPEQLDREQVLAL